MKKIYIVIFFLVLVLILKNSFEKVEAQNNKVSAEVAFSKTQSLALGIDLKVPETFDIEDKKQSKFAKLKNIYNLNKKESDFLNDLEIKLIPFKGNKELSSGEILNKFIKKYVTTEFPFTVTKKTIGTVEVAYTQFSIFSDGEFQSVENYAIVKKGDRYFVVIQGYYRKENINNTYQEDILMQLLENFKFNDKYNETLLNNNL